MKALIKYLPLEGEIKEGDKLAYFGNDSQLKKFWNERVSKQINEQDLGMVSEDFKVMKLFVVTQDIKVGDEVCVYGDMAIVERIDDKLSYIHFKRENKPSNVIFAPKKECYKIIGEVSPEATFVEDGKEYEVRGVKRFTGNTEPCGNTVSHEYKLVFEVKCPCCGTFK